MADRAAKGKFPKATEFMEDAMRRVGAKDIPDLCKKTELDTPEYRREFYKWHGGENRPILFKALPLMRATGMLAEGSEAAANGQASNGPAPGSHEAALAALLAEVRQGFAKLDRRLGRLEKQRAHGEPQPLPKARKAS